MVDEEELKKLREQKKEKLQQQEEEAEQQKQQISQIAKKHLTSEAQSRLERVRMAQPELVSSLEIQIARMGEQTQGKIGDDQLKDILKSIQKEKQDNEFDIKFRR
ncbi:MAG: DNA-binding TFAR19-related protein (PDSD5 family) [Colwellia polaris]|jgi:DNA-binding TFAR19-related protein (PDSD5 family)